MEKDPFKEYLRESELISQEKVMLGVLQSDFRLWMDSNHQNI